MDGELLEEGVPDLEEQCAGAAPPLVLDLTQLVRADDAGLAALARIAGGGGSLCGLSPYIALLLERHQEQIQSHTRTTQLPDIERTK